MKRLTPLVACVCLTASVALPRGPHAAELDALHAGRECTRTFYANAADKLWPKFSTPLRAVFKDQAGLRAFRARVAAQLGDETELLREDVTSLGRLRVYSRRARFAKHAEPVLVTWTYDAQGEVEGFQIAPEVRAAESSYLEYQTKTELRLPFAPGDEWFVFWGGREVAQNYHAAYPDQRFAYDFLVRRDEATHAGEGTENEDYYCFDLPVVAPGDGVVVSVTNTVEDNAPGEMNPAQALGNHVVLDHGNGEYSFLAHFRRGSVLVEKGQEVRAGELLGRCGNSGNSSEPHLHYHVQDAPLFQQGGRGMPTFFLNYVADGEAVERGEPARGQVLRVPE